MSGKQGWWKNILWTSCMIRAMTAGCDRLQVVVDHCLLRVVTHPEARHQSTTDSVMQHGGVTAVPGFSSGEHFRFSLVMFLSLISFHHSECEIHICFYMLRVSYIIYRENCCLFVNNHHLLYILLFESQTASWDVRLVLV